MKEVINMRSGEKEEMLGPISCDTFVVLPPLTKHGVVFGKNSDRPKDEVQEVVYFPAGSPPSKIKCTYIEVESSDPTKAVILSKPGWMWGAEMGSNECNVVIGNEAIWTNDNEGDSDTSIKRLLGMDLVRLGLERSSSAEDALNIICKLLEQYGQGGPCSQTEELFTYHNSFLIADPTEAWVLETSGKHWVAERITSGFRNISNVLTITTKIDKMSDGLLEYAESKGLWNGKDEFNFAQCFNTNDLSENCRYNSGKKLLEELTASNDFREISMFKLLRDKESGICQTCDSTFPTQASQVSVLSNTRPSVHWFTATPDPSQSIFKPFVFTENALVSKHTHCPEDEEPGSPHTLYSLQENARRNSQIIKLLHSMETNCVEELEQLLSSIDQPSAKHMTELDELFKDCVETEVKFYR